MRIRSLAPLLAVFFVGVASVGTSVAQNALRIPDTMEGPTYNLSLAPSTFEFFEGTETAIYGINGGYLGPTLLLEQGAQVQMRVQNLIGEPTTMHWHGMHVAPEDDGGPHTVIPDGTTWEPDFTVMDRATTFWYHPHLHEHTSEHVYRGLAGMIIVRDPIEAALDLPRTYGIDDIPVVIQDRQFNQQRQFVFQEGGVGQQGSTIVVNGTVDPYVELAPGINRLRLLNGSNARVYQIGLESDATFYQIGSDGGLLEAPVALNRLRMAPGERAEILLDLTGLGGSSIRIMSFSSELTRGEPGGVRGAGGPPPPPGDIDGSDFPVLEIRVSSGGTTATTTLPSSLVEMEEMLEEDADRIRPMLLNNTAPGPGGRLAINGVELDMNVINEIVTLGDTEIWELTNRTGGPHPFHIHDVQFQLLDRSGEAPSPSEAGWKDVVLVYPGETVRFITKFEDFANPAIPYMYHCHFLGHEDGGMMGQFIVIDPNATAIEEVLIPDEIGIATYPNPSVDWTTISWSQETRGHVRLEIFDMLGRSVSLLFDGQREAGSNESIWKTGNVPSGVYVVSLKSNNRVVTRLLTVTR